jgi:hypothetical protein
MSREYLIQPKFLDRNANYGEGNYLKESFETEFDFDSPTCGNIGSYFVYDTNEKKIIMNKERIFPLEDNQMSLSRTISSSFALYRLLAILGPLKLTSDGYKSIWYIRLKHKETDNIFTLYDYKGAFSIGSEFVEFFGDPSLINDKKSFFGKMKTIQSIPESFKNDILRLLNLICSDESPHPYDGCVAGSIA